MMMMMVVVVMMMTMEGIEAKQLSVKNVMAVVMMMSAFASPRGTRLA